MKTALITGGAGSIGTLIAKSFAERGAIVTIQDLDKTRIDDVKSSVSTKNENVYAIAADLSSAQECKAVVDKANQLMGGLDIVINTAGINRRKPISEVTPEDLDEE